MFLIILAAGKSKRFENTIPKQYTKLGNKTILEHSLDAFSDFKQIKKTIVVYNKKHKKYLKKLNLKNVIKITGGNTRQQSTFKALSKIKNMHCKKVLIHDSARPFPSKELINKIISNIKKNDAVIPIIKINDATKRVEKNIVFKNIERNSLRLSQTPQGFTFKKIYEKHKKNSYEEFDDDAALFTNDDEKVKFVNWRKKNFKINDKQDLRIYKLLKKGKNYSGIGFDVHKLVKGRNLYLGGIKIPFLLGLEGHSDADPVLHALIDSLLGACRLGDIGKLFSDKNKKYKNIRSPIMLNKVLNLVNKKGYFINNIDMNIIAERPKIKNYRNKIIKSISKLCKINKNKINLKGKTTEKLGLIGKEKAIACEVISSVIKYD